MTIGANPANYPVWCAYYDDLGAVGILNCGATANNNVNIDHKSEKRQSKAAFSEVKYG